MDKIFCAAPTLFYLLRRTSPVLALLACLLPLGPFAQQDYAEENRLRPRAAQEKDLIAYFGISTNVFCTAREEGVEFKKAARISISPVYGVIKELHGNKIPGIKENLSNQELGKYVDNRLFVTASNACPKFFPKDILKKVNKFKKEMKKRNK